MTFTPEQWAYFTSAMRENLQTSAVAFIMQLLNERVKRSVGRPKIDRDREDDANEPDDNDIPKYKVPDKHTTSAYSYNDLVAWYSAHPEEGEMPDRKYLTLHKDYRGKK